MVFQNTFLFLFVFFIFIFVSSASLFDDLPLNGAFSPDIDPKSYTKLEEEEKTYKKPINDGNQRENIKVKHSVSSSVSSSRTHSSLFDHLPNQGAMEQISKKSGQEAIGSSSSSSNYKSEDSIRKSRGSQIDNSKIAKINRNFEIERSPVDELSVFINREIVPSVVNRLTNSNNHVIRSNILQPAVFPLTTSNSGGGGGYGFSSFIRTPSITSNIISTPSFLVSRRPENIKRTYNLPTVTFTNDGGYGNKIAPAKARSTLPNISSNSGGSNIIIYTASPNTVPATTPISVRSKGYYNNENKENKDTTKSEIHYHYHFGNKQQGQEEESTKYSSSKSSSSGYDSPSSRTTKRPVKLNDDDEESGGGGYSARTLGSFRLNSYSEPKPARQKVRVTYGQPLNAISSTLSPPPQQNNNRQDYNNNNDNNNDNSAFQEEGSPLVPVLSGENKNKNRNVYNDDLDERENFNERTIKLTGFSSNSGSKSNTYKGYNNPPPQRGSYQPPPQRDSYQPPPQRDSYQPPPKIRDSYQPPPPQRDTYQQPPPHKDNSYQSYQAPEQFSSSYSQSNYGPPPSYGPPSETTTTTTQAPSRDVPRENHSQYTKIEIETIPIQTTRLISVPKITQSFSSNGHSSIPAQAQDEPSPPGTPPGGNKGGYSNNNYQQQSPSQSYGPPAPPPELFSSSGSNDFRNSQAGLDTDLLLQLLNQGSLLNSNLNSNDDASLLLDTLRLNGGGGGGIGIGNFGNLRGSSALDATNLEGLLGGVRGTGVLSDGVSTQELRDQVALLSQLRGGNSRGLNSQQLRALAGARGRDTVLTGDAIDSINDLIREQKLQGAVIDLRQRLRQQSRHQATQAERTRQRHRNLFYKGALLLGALTLLPNVATPVLGTAAALSSAAAPASAIASQVLFPLTAAVGRRRRKRSIVNQNERMRFKFEAIERCIEEASRKIKSERGIARNNARKYYLTKCTEENLIPIQKMSNLPKMLLDQLNSRNNNNMRNLTNSDDNFTKGFLPILKDFDKFSSMSPGEIIQRSRCIQKYFCNTLLQIEQIPNRESILLFFSTMAGDVRKNPWISDAMFAAKNKNCSKFYCQQDTSFIKNWKRY